MKLKLISLQDILRVVATILHPPIESAASSPTSRQDGEAKNELMLIDETFIFVLSTGCRSTESSGEDNGNTPDDDAAPNEYDDEDEDDDENNVRTSGNHAPATAKLK